MITYTLDRFRMTIGDSLCPLYPKCKGADEDSDVCTGFRGRDGVGGNRAGCYRFYKKQIRAQKQGSLALLTEKLIKGVLHIGGLEE